MKKVSVYIISSLIFGASFLNAQNAQIANLAQDVASLQQELGQLRSDIEETNRQNLQYRQQIADLKASNDALNARVQELRGQMSSQRSEILAIVDKKNDDLVKDVNASLTKMGKVVSSSGSTTRSSDPAVVPTFSSDFPKEGIEYTVEAGDTLEKIARKFNSTVAYIQNANKISDPKSLKIGQKLFIPQRSGN